MNISDIDIYELIPQRPPMVMVDCVVECDDVITVTTFTVTDDCLFVDSGILTAEGLLENIAQTCAARIGYLNRLAGHAVKLGFIGAVKTYNVVDRPAIGDTVETTITVKEEIFGITLVDAIVRLAGREIASTTMKIALSDINAQQ